MISKKEYKKLKQHSSAYQKIVDEITKAEREYSYDYGHIGRISKEAKREKWIEARSVDEALAKSRKK